MELDPTSTNALETISKINQKFIHAKKFKIKNVNVILLDKRLYTPNYYKLVLKWECIEPKCQSGIYFQKNNFEYFKSRDLHSDHKHIDFDGNTYSCLKCSAKFDDFNPMYFHAIAHTNIFECVKCDKKFTRNIDLLQHVSSCSKQETSDSQFTCDRCRATHTNLADFIEHMKIPHNQPISPLPVPQKSNDMFKCHECNFSTDILQNFLFHYYIHHKFIQKILPQFDCEFCIFSFQHFSDLYDHIETNHGDEISAHFMSYLYIYQPNIVSKTTNENEIRLKRNFYKILKKCNLNKRIYWTCRLKFCKGMISTSQNLTEPLIIHEHTEIIHAFFEKSEEYLEKFPINLHPTNSSIQILVCPSIKIGHWQGFLYVLNKDSVGIKTISWSCIEKTCEAVLTSDLDFSKVKFKDKSHNHDCNLFNSMPHLYKPYRIVKGTKDILIWNRQIYTEKNYNSVLFNNSWHCVVANCPGAVWISRKTSSAQLYHAHNLHSEPRESDYISGDASNPKSSLNMAPANSNTNLNVMVDKPNIKFYCDSCDAGKKNGFPFLNNLIDHLKMCPKKKKDGETNSKKTPNLNTSSSSSNRIVFERRLNFQNDSFKVQITEEKRPKINFSDTGDIFFSKMVQDLWRKNEPFNPSDLSIYPYATNVVRIVPYIEKHPQIFYKSYFYKFSRALKNIWEWKCTVCQAILKTDFHYESPSLVSKHIGPHETKNKFEIAYLKAFMRYEIAISNISPESIYSIITGMYDKQLIDELELEKESILLDLEKLRKLFQRHE